MGRGYEVAVGADGRQFNQAIQKDVIKPVEDAARSLDELADTADDASKDASRGLEKLEDGLSEVERAADDAGTGGSRSIGRLEEALRDAQDRSKATEKAVDDIGDAGNRGFRRLGDAGSEVSGELRQNLGETFSSFRGDLEDLPQIAQDTLGGLAGSGALGGIAGLAATAAGAAGLGLIIGAFDEIDKRNEESQKRVSEWADKFIEAGDRVLTAGQIIASTNDILRDSEKFAKATEAAELWGVTFETAALAMSGHSESIQAVSGALNDQRRAFEDARDAGELTYEQQDKVLKQLGDAISQYADLTGEMEQGSTRAGIYSAALKNVAKTTEGATTKVDEFGDSVTTLPDGTTIYIDAETGRATDNVDAIKDKIYGIRDKDVKVNVRTDLTDLNRQLRSIKAPTIVVPAEVRVQTRGRQLG